MKKTKIFTVRILPALIIAFIVILDQAVKTITANNLELNSTKEFIKGVLNFTHVRNTGAAFSMFSDNMVFLIIVTVPAIAVMFWFLYFSKIKSMLFLVSLSMVMGGAAGNMADRIANGFVVDMFEFAFVDFAIFNIADIFITCGGVLLAVYFVFYYKPNKKQ